MIFPPPIITIHEGVHVVRDDLFFGGTKARFLPILFEKAEEVVYASPAQGGAQSALAATARQLGKKATVFVAKRAKPHDRTLQAKRFGARIFQVDHGYLNVVQARARKYCEDTGALLAPFGMDLPEALTAIAEAAKSTGVEPEEVWCAAGSGVLIRSLAKAWPKANLRAVQVGRDLTPEEVAGALIFKHHKTFNQAAPKQPPFPSDPHYDAKAWEILMRHKAAWQGRRVLFWNVTGIPTQ